MGIRNFLIGAFIGLTLFFAYLVSLPDQKLHLVFCDVGQGDAAYIRAPNNMDMLIDGGPNDKVLNCLGRHMPFYDRTIDVVMLSHAQRDHLQGLLSVLERYEVKYVITTPVGNGTEGYKKFIDIIKTKNIPVKNLYQGDEFLLGQVKFKILWPEKKWLTDHTLIMKTGDANNKEADAGRPCFLSTPTASTPIKSGEFGRCAKKSWPTSAAAMGPVNYNQKGVVLGLQSDTDLNSFSYFVHLNYGTFDALFTGDGDRKIQPEIMDLVELPDIEVLKFPHHGSKTGILAEFLTRIKPELAVISVGNNSYGHPTKEAIDLLRNRAVDIKRTDQDGDIEINTDGVGWNQVK